MSWLYLAVRSPLEGAPALIWPALVATAKSAIVVSSVSPERWLITTPYEAPRACSMTSRVSVSVPIWLTLTRMAVPMPSLIPRPRRSGFVTKMSSPTTWHRPPSSDVRAAQPSQSSSARGSSIETMGKESSRPRQNATMSAAERSCPSSR